MWEVAAEVSVRFQIQFIFGLLLGIESDFFFISRIDIYIKI